MAYKYIRVKVVNNPQGVNWARKNNQPVMIYPDEFHLIDWIFSTYYSDEVQGDFYFIGVCDEKFVNQNFLNNENVTEMTKADMITLSEQVEPQIEEIKDEGKLRRIEIKTRLGQALTTDEEKAIDPADPTLGINYKKRLADMIQASVQLGP